MKKLRIATVFSGIGALEQALRKEKIEYEVIFACDNGERELPQTYCDLQKEIEESHITDIDQFIAKKYEATGKKNYVKNTYLVNYYPQKWYEDIRFLDGTKYKNDIDLFVGGSPCQSFSVLGKRAGLDDTRGTLFYDFARLVNEIKPKAFIFENVPGMLNHDKGNTWKIIRDVFESLKYTISYEILNSIDYGIPQIRKRLFVIGIIDPTIKFEFPQPKKLEKTMYDYLEKQVDAQFYLGKKGFEFVTNTSGKYKNRASINQPIIKTQVANQQFNWIGDFVFENYQNIMTRNDIMARAYVGTYEGALGVVRQLTPRECLRLMGFDDDFVINVPSMQAYRQIGNSIVVNVLQEIIKSICKTGIYDENNELKVATVFSGIGAVEYALKVLKKEFRTQFACDNGGRNISYDHMNEFSKVKELSSIDDKKLYVDSLYHRHTSSKNFVQQSYMANHNIEHSRFFQDIRLLDGRDFEGKVDLFVGGSPCQSFSTVGFQQGLEDARGTLFYEYARLIKEIRPKVFIYENVHGLLTHDHGNTFNIIRGIFDSLGYKYFYSTLNSKDYGLPQNRRRLFVVGFLDSTLNFKFPPSQQLTLKMQDLLIDNTSEGNVYYEKEKIAFRKLAGFVDDKYYLSEKLYRYVMSSGTKTFFQKPEIDLPIARTILSTMGNRHRAGIDNYVTINGSVRMLTEREAHRLMGFADDYRIVVSRAQAYKQAGNSIAIPVLVEILREIFKVTHF